MERANNQGCQMVGMLDIKGQDQCRRVYSVNGIAPTLTTSGGGQREVKIFDTKRLRVRKLTPKEYGILQAFPMDDWKQVVSDSQAYKQFGNAVTTTVFTAIAEEIAKSIYAAEESEEQNMEAENKNFTGINEPEEKPTAESILATVEAEAQAAAGQEETTKTAITAEETITPDTLAAGMLHFLLDSGIVASACVTDETEKMFAKHIKEEGEYKIFKVFEPKERLIMALPFYDRVVQHMICNAIQPVFENGFYYHSYACRSGKGMHAASDTLYQWMYETEVKQGLRMYAFKGDISKYFASIPHDKLKDENRRYIGG